MDLHEYKTITENAEMTVEDHNFILGLLAESKPKKILEIGVCSGGTTNLLLKALPLDATLYSVDIAKQYPRDPSKNTGYVAARDYNPAVQAQWITYFGYDISYCIEEIGSGIDFTIIDTTHVLPGEILSFLAVLPFLKEESFLVLHDISNHMLHKLANDSPESYNKNEYCTSLLFSSIFSNRKYMSEACIPNCGAVHINRNATINNMNMILNMLFIDWYYLPENKILAETLKIAQRFYSEKDATLLERAFQYNIKQEIRKKIAPKP
jgi:hypothetical protein